MSEEKRGDRRSTGVAKQRNKGAGGRPVVRKGGRGQGIDKGAVRHQRRIGGGRENVQEGEGHK